MKINCVVKRVSPAYSFGCYDKKNIYIITFHYAWKSNTRHLCKFRDEKKRISVFAYYVSKRLRSTGIII